MPTQGVTLRLLGPHDTLPCVLISNTHLYTLLAHCYTLQQLRFYTINCLQWLPIMLQIVD